MMYQQEIIIVDDEISHEKKHQQHKLDHTKDKIIINNGKKNKVCFYTLELFDNKVKV